MEISMRFGTFYTILTRMTSKIVHNFKEGGNRLNKLYLFEVQHYSS